MIQKDRMCIRTTALSSLPMDVHQVDSAALIRAGAQHTGDQWLVIAGQDFSSAGAQRDMCGVQYDKVKDRIGYDRDRQG
jgi:hypothetical protein